MSDNQNPLNGAEAPKGPYQPPKPFGEKDILRPTLPPGEYIRPQVKGPYLAEKQGGKK
jgi:hypothetical protein